MKHRKVLVVDDSLPALKLASEILLYNGYDVIKTTSGKKGIIYAVEYQPDLILLDIMMPNVDGITVLEKVREFDSTKDIPVAMLTASKNLNDIKKTKELGIKKYFLKPISINSFVEAIRQMTPMDDYDGVGAYLNGDNFINEQDEDDNLDGVMKECEDILLKKENAGRVGKVLKKESKRETQIKVIDGYPVKYIKLTDLKPGMTPGNPIITKGGMVVHPAGVELNEKTIKKIQSDDFDFDVDNIPIRG